MDKSFHTLKGYDLLEKKKLTYAMEDYLEMICRVCQKQGYVRVSQLARLLNVSAPSVNKMVNNLKDLSLVSFERYGYIMPTDAGNEIGAYLMQRHDILNRFLCYINNSDDELEQVEKIEHFLNRKTINSIELFLRDKM